MNKTDFLLKLKLQKGIGYVKLLQIASQLDVEEVDSAAVQKLDLPFNLAAAAFKALNDEQADQTVARIKKQCQVISFFNQEYPDRLREIYQPPLILFARGNVSLLKSKIVTIVGARLASHYSQEVIDRLMPNLVASNLTIASGLAKGVDGFAHRACLKNNGQTIAVVGNGLNHYYPSQNHGLQDQIVDKGLIISEYLPDTPPRPFRFPQRNRILAGISDSVIVTEAKEKSGSLITANLALQENRNVYAVPGPITSPLSEGPNRLIEVGATPIVDFKLETENIF
ncbi:MULTISPECIES: DNA-processing protein DprA [Lactobacillus]|uniref:DNA-protecting protein DprA n=1 Tax=Lactobacillus xujianguonis TaxID=2495899 RepID=A0A437SY32_9LACO|nr:MULTISPECIES: DNA-processing protein DprA [Lactobacillus]RVU71818.1 DNA-protecting protein DprA [Lactobacillus xujianguonis]RVU77594.1 DNA-protecting protein DprA [Lactobacillus xujianguonis]